MSITEYINPSRGAGKGWALKGSLVPPGCCNILANGLWFQSLEAVFGSWLARG